MKKTELVETADERTGEPRRLSARVTRRDEPGGYTSASTCGFIHLCALCALCGSLSLTLRTAAASDLDEFKVKREAVFEFAEKPQVTRQGDRVTIRFATKGLCDATVAVEDAEGRILRHLASGVLGPRAPEPFQKDSKAQTLVWDGKDDQGRYIDDKDRLTVRVSLGLAARFERDLLWEPKRRWSTETPLLAAAPEGVYVFDEGRGAAQLRLFDHDGNYVRTLYPFPANRLETFTDLVWQTFPQDGKRLPLKGGAIQATLLSSGNDAGFSGPMGVGPKHSVSNAATAMAVRGTRVALANERLNRLATDGSSGGRPLGGPKTSVAVISGARPWYGGGKPVEVGPTSMALSPDGRWLYLAGYNWDENHGTGGTQIHWLHGVVRMPYDGQAGPERFAGNMAQGERYAGTQPEAFKVPTSVVCDAEGRVYVCDYMNDRIQVFSPDGAFLRAISVAKPVQVAIHHRTGDFYVFSWFLKDMLIWREKRGEEFLFEPRLTVLGPPESPQVLATYRLPLRGHPTDRLSPGDRNGGRQYRAALDSWAEKPTIWLVPAIPDAWSGWERAGILILRIEGDRLVTVRDFGQEAKRSAVQLQPAANLRQRLYVNPADGLLYVHEGSAGVGKSSSCLLEVNPETGAVRLVELPFDAEDVAFDASGFAYLRGLRDVARFDPRTWREVPWDYGEAQPAVGFASSAAEGAGMRRANVAAAVHLPVSRYNHHGGMMVSPKGHLVVSIHGTQEVGSDRRGPDVVADASDYTFRLYPGRSTAGLVLVFDPRGQVLYDDAIPGIAFTHGVGIDKDDNVYAMAMAARVLDGAPYFNLATDTVVKFKPGRGKILCTHAGHTPVPLSATARPARPPDLTSGGGGRLKSAWAEGAEWFYGGVGFHDRHDKSEGYGCDCHNSRFDLDYFARSFAPEVGHSSVAVLDSSGNLILRIGRYGNVDSAGASSPIPLGSDEVGLFYAPYVATHTDRRVFIADVGNRRIVSVRLSYHAEARVPLSDVPDADRPDSTAKDAKNAEKDETE